MDPIISPWFIYLISVLDSIKVVLVLGCGVTFLVWGVSVSAMLDNEENAKVTFKYSSIMLVICIILSILIPNRETMLTMLTLHYVTPDNLALVQDNAVDFVQRIVGAIKGVKL